MSSKSKQTTLLRFLPAKRKNKQQKTTKSQPLIKPSEQEDLPLVEIDSGWNIIRINSKIAKSLFAKTVKTYYGLGKNYVAENLLENKEKVEFLRKVYELFPYNYLAKSENGIPYYEYYSTAENIDIDIINHLQLTKIGEYQWEELDPHIAVRLITAHIRSSFEDFLKNRLSSRELKDVWIRLPNGRERVSLEFVKKFELGTLGYSIEDGEIWMALRRRSSASAVLLADFPPKVLEYVMIKLKKLAKEAVKQDYRKVRIYSETQPGSGTAAVIDVIIGHDNVIRFLKEHPKGAFHVKKRLEELGKGLDDVNYLLIGVYDNSISLKRALEDENCQYYFTEHNAYLVLTTEVQKELFGGIIDDWRGEIVEEYQRKLKEITSGKLFSQVSGIKGVTVNIRENLLVRTLKGEMPVKDVRDIMRDESIFPNLLPISEKILNETKRHNLRLLIFYPKKFDKLIRNSIFLDQIERLRNGLLSNSFSDVEEVGLIPISGDRSLDYHRTMLEAGLDKVKDYTLATIIFPEQYNKRDLELREFYNWLKKEFYDETKPLVFQGARVESVFGKYKRYAVPNIVLQMAAKLGVYPYSLETSSGYDYIIGIDYTYWHERDAVSVGGGAVVVSPSGLIEGIYPIAIPSKKESLDMKEILQEWFLKTVQNNPEIMERGKVTVLISRDGMVPKYERNRIQEFLCEYSDELDMTIEAVEVRKRILTRIWSLDGGPNTFYSPVKVGKYTYYIVNAHTGYPLKRGGKKIYYSKPYLIGSLYRFQSGKVQAVHDSARRHLVESLIRLQKINYTTTKMDNVRLPLPIDITHKLINFIRDVNMRVKRVGIPNSLFMA
ncbi:Piwi domain-containing protein [Archaeoglobus sp.]